MPATRTLEMSMILPRLESIRRMKKEQRLLLDSVVLGIVVGYAGEAHSEVKRRWSQVPGLASIRLICNCFKC